MTGDGMNGPGATGALRALEEERERLERAYLDAITARVVARDAREEAERRARDAESEAAMARARCSTTSSDERLTLEALVEHIGQHGRLGGGR